MSYDLAIIGGGINGTAIAADAAGRGLRVFLCEKNDLASGTSSVSSKLIHGGLRYLEQYDFKLVRESLLERAILLQRAPHLVRPLSFVMPDHADYHSPWLIKLGLFLYDFLAHDKQLPRSKRISLSALPIPSHLKVVNKGFIYSDCWGNDARLVIANAQLARQKGAVIATCTELLSAIREKEYWSLDLSTGEKIQAKAIINAAGPWADRVNQQLNRAASPRPNLRLVKGSHILVKKFYTGSHAFVLQNQDDRIIFLIPFDDEFLLVGTTDVLYEGSLEHINISDDEINYLKKSVEDYFDIEIRSETIVWSYSGVRPLYDDHENNPSKITRDYSIVIEDDNNLPLVTIYGGKLTTHRCLAEKMLKKIKNYFPSMSGPWTRKEALPGGEISDYFAFLKQCKTHYPWLSEKLLNRYVSQYGTNIAHLLKNTAQLSDLGHYFGATLYEKEVRYLIDYEWAKTADDILWRRTKLGLYLSHDEVAGLKAKMFALEA
ncbi:MAG: glycerol-3-phosphate dehydrogenase [Gammaproteobacteria bacterium]|nr:glycerol-3-phosphate dehydrogenase [Gammaproteobacteria bacterium]